MPAEFWNSFVSEILLDGVIKASIILAIAWTMTALLRRMSASVRHRIWSTSFVGLACLPALAVLVPNWNLDYDTLSRGTKADPPPALEEYMYQTDGLGVAEPPLVGVFEKSGTAAQPTYRPKIDGSSGGARNFGLPVRTFFVLWISGVFVILGCVVKDLVRISLISRRASFFDPSLKHNRTWAAVSIPRICRSIQFARSDEIDIPFVWGVTRPVIILPTESENWSDERLRVVLAHELAHVQRLDYPVHLLVQLMCALYWMNPMVWFAARRVAMEQERACDDHVVHSGTPSGQYARHLLALAGSTGGKAPGGLALARPSMLKERVLALLDSECTVRISGGFVRSILVLVLAATVAIAAFDPWIEDSDRLDRESLRQAIEALEDPDPLVRQRAAWSLGEMESSEALDPLIRRLDDADSRVRKVSVWALGEIKNPDALDPLVVVLDDQEKLVRDMAVRALGEIEDSAAVPNLLETLRDSDPGLRTSVVWALGEIGSTWAVAAILASLSDSSTSVRFAAVDALSKAANRPCCREGASAKGGVRKNLVEGIETAIRDVSPDVRRRAVQALVDFEGLDAVDLLVRVLNDPNPLVRIEAARVLGELRSDRAVDALLDRLPDTHPGVRSMVVWALDEIEAS